MRSWGATTTTLSPPCSKHDDELLAFQAAASATRPINVYKNSTHCTAEFALHLAARRKLDRLLTCRTC